MPTFTKLQKNARLLGYIFAIFLTSHLFAKWEHEVGVNVHFMLDVKAKFKNPSSALGTLPNPGPPSGGGIDRFYDDGFNRVGLNGNPLGLTSFWGYDNASQLPGNDTLVLNATVTSLPSLEAEGKDNSSIQEGVEIFFKFPLGDDDRVDGEWNWGIRESISYFAINLEDKRAAQGDVIQISDEFALNGVIPPTAPYVGSFTGPGPLISDNPVRSQTIIANSAFSSIKDELDAGIFSYGIGPYWEFYTHDNLELSLDGGFLFSWIFSKYKFSDITILSGSPTQREDSGRKSTFLFGGFIGGTIHIKLNSKFAILGDVRYRIMEDFDHKEKGRKAELDFTGLTTLGIGLSYSF